MKILLAEDNEPNRIVLNAMLMSINKENKVTVVGSGMGALEEFDKNTFDLILLDCELEDIDGYDVTLRIRTLEKEKGLNHTPIIAVTAYVFMKDLNRCLQSGMDGYLSKPVSMADFKALLFRWQKKLI